MNDEAESVFDVIEALCQHHSVGDFSATDEPEYEHWLDVFWERAAQAVGDRVLVAAKKTEVRGFMSSIDFPLDEPNGYEGVYFYVSAVAISDPFRGTSILTALARTTIESVDLVESTRGDVYRGVLARPGRNRALQAALRSLDFHPIPTTVYWAKIRATD